MKCDRSNKLDFCYYGQVNSLRLKSGGASKWATSGNFYFAGYGTNTILPIKTQGSNYTVFYIKTINSSSHNIFSSANYIYIYIYQSNIRYGGNL